MRPAGVGGKYAAVYRSQLAITVRLLQLQRRIAGGCRRGTR